MIIAKLKGGLGNQMFQYALGLRLALEFRVPLKLDLSFLLDRSPEATHVLRDFDLGIFGIAEGEPVPEQVRAAAIQVEEKVFGYEPRLVDALRPHAQARDILLEGYWQCRDYFRSAEPEVRDAFTIRVPIREHVARLAQRILSEEAVCLNVRRGDFVHLAQSAKFHGFRGLEYINAAAGKMSSRISAPVFYVFSDDIEWCESNIRIDAPVMFVGQRYAGAKFAEYLYLMIQCKHFIIPNSSFGWWAAWLSARPDKSVIAPLRWFEDPSVDTTHVCPPEWERV